MMADSGILGKTYSMAVAYYVQTTAGGISAEWSWSDRIGPSDDAAPSSSSADADVTEAGDLARVAATLLIPAAANFAEGGDSLTALGNVASPITANIAIAEPNNIISSKAVLSQSGSVDVLDADNVDRMGGGAYPCLALPFALAMAATSFWLAAPLLRRLRGFGGKPAGGERELACIGHAAEALLVERMGLTGYDGEAPSTAAEGQQPRPLFGALSAATIQARLRNRRPIARVLLAVLTIPVRKWPERA